MGKYNSRKKLMALKAEAASGTFEALVGADVIEVLDLNGDRGGQETYERRIENGVLGKKKSGRKPSAVPNSFGVEIRGGGGAVDDLTQLDVVLRMMGFAPTVNAAVSVQYDPVDDGFETFSTVRHFDNFFIKSRGAIADGSIEFNAGEIPMINVSAMGMDEGHGDAAPVVAAPLAAADPLVVSDENTTATLDSLAAPVKSLSLTVARDISYENLVNQERMKQGDRMVTGSITIVLPLVGDENYVATALAGTEVPISVVHGISAGNIFEVSIAQAQLDSPSFSEDGDQLLATFNFQANVTAAGQDDCQFLTR